MEIWVLVALSVYAVFAGHWNAWENAKSVKKPQPSLKPPKATKSLSDYIPKDRSIQQAQHREWDQQNAALRRATCKGHYGKVACKHCYVSDMNTPWNCHCDVVEVRNMDGSIALYYIKPEKNCKYHSKDHYFVNQVSTTA